MQRALLVLVAILTLAYPALVYFSQDTLDPQWVVLVPLMLGLLRLSAGRRDPMAILLISCAVINAIPVWVVQDDGFLKAYPSLVSLAFLLLFLISLIKPPTMIERIARAETPDLPPWAIAYTRRVTEIWCLFFLFNGSVATWTALYASEEVWLAWTGCISYILIGVLFAIEWLVRQRLHKRHA